jgi:hypothetical protein
MEFVQTSPEIKWIKSSTWLISRDGHEPWCLPTSLHSFPFTSPSSALISFPIAVPVASLKQRTKRFSVAQMYVELYSVTGPILVYRVGRTGKCFGKGVQTFLFLSLLYILCTMCTKWMHTDLVVSVCPYTGISPHEPLLDFDEIWYGDHIIGGYFKFVLLQSAIPTQRTKELVRWDRPQRHLL